MEFPLKSSEMTLFLFQILVFYSEVLYTLVPDADQVAKSLKVSHFDCGALTENTLYALNQIRQCHITPEEMEISQTKIILYTKHFRKELNTTKCRIQHQREKWHCGDNDHSSIDHTVAGITRDPVISSEQCRSLAKGKMIYLAYQFLAVEYDTKNPLVIRDGSKSDNSRNHWTERDWITRDTFLPHMQRTTLKVRMSTRKVLSDSAWALPCALEELGCETTSLDPYAYIWDYPDNFVLSIFRTEEVNMLKQGKNIKSSVDLIEPTHLYLKLKTILKTLWKADRHVSDQLRFPLCSDHQLRLRLELWKEPWSRAEWCYSISTVYCTHGEWRICSTLSIWPGTHVPQNKRWRHLSDYRLWNAHGNKIGLSLLPQLTITSSFWVATHEKPMWGRTNTDSYYFDAICWKPTPWRIYANWKPVNVSRNWWKLSLAFSLPTSSFTISYDEPVLRQNPDTLRWSNSLPWPHYTSNTPRC